MSQRLARIEDNWRTAQNRNFPVRYEELRFEDLSCLGNGEIEFNGGITALVGGNGVGKSTVAAGIGELLGAQSNRGFSGNSARLSGSVLYARIHEPKGLRTRMVVQSEGNKRKLTGDELDSECNWLDPAFVAHHLKTRISQDSNFADLLDPISPIKLGPEELQDISYLVGKDYESCDIYEIEDYADFDVLPYFQVKSNGMAYGSEGMGQGELSLLLVYSTLKALKDNSILVLEEPETHVSPRSQNHLMNIIARHCADRGIWTIITTHSPVIISRLQSKDIRLLLRDGNAVSIVKDPHRYQLAGILGGGDGFRGVILVEDDVAKELCLAIFEEYAPDLLRQFELIAAGSAVAITEALTRFPKTRKWLSVIGVYDGDMVGKISGQGFNWPHSFLPMAQSPEEVLRPVAVQNRGADVLAEELRKSKAEILAAIEASSGLNSHDWIIECARQLTVTRAELVKGLFHIWVRSGVIDEAVKTFVRELEKKYNQN